MKKTFTLLITIILITIFSLLNILTIENQTISSNIDKLKYFNLQSNIHMKYIKQFIKNHSENEINNFVLDDNRFDVKIILENSNNTKKYHIWIKTVDDIFVKLYCKISLN